jgi:DUF4097 and DUF4098 domain-containing protein YvlB
MPTFDTPSPIHARIELSGGSVRVRADARRDTVVDVRPSDPGSSADAQLADQTRVEYADGRLTVSVPRRPRLLFFGGSPSVHVEVLVPERSHLDVSSTAGDVDCEGQLGDVRVDTKYGDIRVDHSSAARVRTAAGDIAIAAADGPAEASTSYGEIRIARASGDLQLDSACGDITVDCALGSVGARTKYGQVRVHEAVHGSLDLETAYGAVEAGIRAGTAAWLDVAAASGRVRNLLTESDGPEGGEDSLRVRARTAYGNILIRRA